MTDFDTWMLDYSDRTYRYWVRKRMFTPLEQDQKYVDQSCYEDPVCSYGCIVEAVELPDGDILLGFADQNNEGHTSEGYITYHKLSEIDLAYNPSDDIREYDEDDDE